MWSSGTDLFVQLPAQTAMRVLLGGTVSGFDDGVIQFRPNDRLAVEAGQDLRIYFERSREFMQQPARVEAVLDTDRGTILAIRPEGEAVSAEDRQCYRVSTIFAELRIDVEGEACPLTDVSVQGFSIISKASYRQGQTIAARLIYEGKSYEGRAQVQSLKDLGGSARYGLLCAGTKSSGAAGLDRGLQQVSMGVQRMQLRRRAGA